MTPQEKYAAAVIAEAAKHEALAAAKAKRIAKNARISAHDVGCATQSGLTCDCGRY